MRKLQRIIILGQQLRKFVQTWLQVHRHTGTKTSQPVQRRHTQEPKTNEQSRKWPVAVPQFVWLGLVSTPRLDTLQALSWLFLSSPFASIFNRRRHAKLHFPRFLIRWTQPVQIWSNLLSSRSCGTTKTGLVCCMFVAQGTNTWRRSSRLSLFSAGLWQRSSRDSEKVSVPLVAVSSDQTPLFLSTISHTTRKWMNLNPKLSDLPHKHVSFTRR